MTQTAQEQASARVKDVERAFDEALGAWTGVGCSLGSLIGMTPQNQVLNAIKQMRTFGIEPWKARRAKLTEADEDGWDRWVKDGNDMLKNLASTAQDANVSSIQGIVTQTVAETTKDVKAAGTAVWQFKWGIVALAGAAAFIVWKLK